MSKQTFIVSDERRNSYGTVIKTDGMDISDFCNNPIMYYMHDREAGVVGRWENIRKEGARLLMDAVFDTSSELGARVGEQVEKGFLRCASVGIDNVRTEKIDNIETIVSCRLVEVSIVDIPANRNALKLCDKWGKNGYKFISMQGIDTQMNLREALLGLLSLSPLSSDVDIYSAVETLVYGRKTPEEYVSDAVAMCLIDESERSYFEAMAAADESAFLSLINSKKRSFDSKLDDAILQAARGGKISYADKVVYERIANIAGAKLAIDALNAICPRPSVAAMIRDYGGKQGNIAIREGWGLTEYRKNAPEELANNPRLYAALLEREKECMTLNADTLDYYRRNNPEYLKTHPDEYKRVLEQYKKTIN